MTVFEMAKKYYPLLWNESRINALFKAGKLTEEEYNEIIGARGEDDDSRENTDNSEG